MQTGLFNEPLLVQADHGLQPDSGRFCAPVFCVLHHAELAGQLKEVVELLSSPGFCGIEHAQ